MIKVSNRDKYKVLQDQWKWNPNSLVRTLFHRGTNIGSGPWGLSRRLLICLFAMYYKYSQQREQYKQMKRDKKVNLGDNGK